MCRNDELSSTMSWVGCLLTDSEFFILFAETSKILAITILLTFMYLVALNLLVNNQLNSSLNSTHYCGTQLSHLFVPHPSDSFENFLNRIKPFSNFPDYSYLTFMILFIRFLFCLLSNVSYHSFYFLVAFIFLSVYKKPCEKVAYWFSER